MCRGTDTPVLWVGASGLQGLGMGDLARSAGPGGVQDLERVSTESVFGWI